MRQAVNIPIAVAPRQTCPEKWKHGPVSIYIYFVPTVPASQGTSLAVGVLQRRYKKGRWIIDMGKTGEAVASTDDPWHQLVESPANGGFVLTLSRSREVVRWLGG